MKTKIQTISRYAVAAVTLVFLACIVNFISAPSGTAESRINPLPKTLSQKSLVEKIVEHRDFFVRFKGNDGDLLCDVDGGFGKGRVGLLLLEPSGFLKSLVFDRGTLKKIHEDTSIPPKKVRADLARGAVSVTDVRLIAQNIVGLRENTLKKPRRGSERREAMPQSLPEGFAQPATQRSADTEEILDRLRRDVANNPEVAAMTRDEILERFRTDIQRSSQSGKAAGSR